MQGGNATTDETPTPKPDLASLERLVGTWQVSGDAQEQARYEWAEGKFFLLQHFDIVHGGRTIKGIEVIGHLRPLDGVPSAEIWTRVYSFVDGLTPDYVYAAVIAAITIAPTPMLLQRRRLAPRAWQRARSPYTRCLSRRPTS